MDQEGQHVILCPKSLKIVLELRRVDCDLCSADELRDRLLQPVKIHVNVIRHRLCGGGRNPKRTAVPFPTGTHDRVRIVHRVFTRKLITVVP